MKKLINNFLMFLILGIRPLLGVEGFCRFPITCTQYAELKLNETTFLKALWQIFVRVISCNPLMPKSWLKLY